MKSGSSLRITKGQSKKATIGRGELVLPPARHSRLHRFQVAGGLGDLEWVASLASSGAQGGDQSHVERSGAAQSGAGRRVGPGQQSAPAHRQHSKACLLQVQSSISNQTGRIAHLQLIVEVFGNETEAGT